MTSRLDELQHEEDELREIEALAREAFALALELGRADDAETARQALNAASIRLQEIGLERAEAATEAINAGRQQVRQAEAEIDRSHYMAAPPPVRRMVPAPAGRPASAAAPRAAAPPARATAATQTVPTDPTPSPP